MANVLTFIIAGQDKLSSKFKSAGDNAEKAQKKMGHFSEAGALAGVAVGAALVKFGKDSVHAFAEAQEGQRKLSFAFEKFPALADVNISALQDMNTALAKKTKFDDDAIASGQAQLAQFKLTGKQIKDTTPLLLDYASRTGKDVPDAANDVGKALLGNAKALKNIGIFYKSTGNATKDFTNITALMRQKVGGFAETEGKTATGQIAILRNQFGELEETAGSHLVPALQKLATVGLQVIDFISRNSSVILPLIGAFAGLVTALYAYAKVQALVNFLMTANPIGLVVIGVAALAVGIAILWRKSETFRAIVTGAFDGVKVAFNALKDAGAAVVNFFQVAWDKLPGILMAPINGVVFLFHDLPIRILAKLAGFGGMLYQKGIDFLTGLKNGIMSVAKGIGDWMLRAPVVKVLAPWVGAGYWLITHGKGLIHGFLDGVWSIAKGVGTWFNTNVIAPTVRVFVNSGVWLYDKGSRLIHGLLDGVWSVAKGVGGWFNTNVIQPQIRLFINSGTWLYVHGSRMIHGLLNGVWSVAQNAGKWWYTNVIAPPVALFANAGTWLVDKGVKLIGGLKDGVVSQMKDIGKWIKSTIVDPVIKNVKIFFGIKSPSTVFAGIGRYLIAGLFKGMGTGIGGAVAKKVFGDMPSALSALLNKGLIGMSGLPKKALDALGNVQQAIVPGNIGVLSGPNKRVFYQGEALDYSTYLKLKKAEQLVGHLIHVTQGSYEKASSYSGTTHTGGGVLDVSRGNLTLYQKVMRAVGFAAWDRTGKGNWLPHVHAVEIGNTRAAASAQGQVRDYMRGGDGLAGFRNGGWWMPGMIGINETATPEAVFNQDQLKMMGSGGIDYEKLAEILVRAAKQARPVEVGQHFPVGADPESAARAAADRLIAALGG
jgi:hypothetical protein